MHNGDSGGGGGGGSDGGGSGGSDGDGSGGTLTCTMPAPPPVEVMRAPYRLSSESRRHRVWA